MGKGARKTGRNRTRNVPLRKSQRRPQKRKLLIVGEGNKTERLYFDELRREDAVTKRLAVTVKGAGGFSREDIVQKAIVFKQQAAQRGKAYAYDEVWCVLDVEHRGHRESLEKAKILADGNHIKLCLSNPSFEIWLLSHWVRQSRAFENGDKVTSELEKVWQEKFNRVYDKGDKDIYRLTRPFLDQALENAKHVREQLHSADENTSICNSCTDIFGLISYLFDRSSCPKSSK